MSGTMNCGKGERYYELLYYMSSHKWQTLVQRLNILRNNRQIKSINIFRRRTMSGTMNFFKGEQYYEFLYYMSSLQMTNISPKT